MHRILLLTCLLTADVCYVQNSVTQATDASSQEFTFDRCYTSAALQGHVRPAT